MVEQINAVLSKSIAWARILKCRLDESGHDFHNTQASGEHQVQSNASSPRSWSLDGSRGNQASNHSSDEFDTEDGLQTANAFDQPPLISVALRGYQLLGVQWSEFSPSNTSGRDLTTRVVLTLYDNGLNGILADDMGLGKVSTLFDYYTGKS